MTNHHPDFDPTETGAAVLRGDADFIRCYLAAGGSPDQWAEGWPYGWAPDTLIEYAVRHQQTEIVRVLLEAGAQGFVWEGPRARDVLCLAIRTGNVELVQICRQKIEKWSHIEWCWQVQWAEELARQKASSALVAELLPIVGQSQLTAAGVSP